MRKFLQTSILIAITYFIIMYNDTDEFQSVMKFIFGSSPYSPSPYWLENRLFILGGICLLLILLYQSVWTAYKQLIHIYRNSPVMSTKPPLTAQQASYIYLKNDALCVSLWLIELCQSGVLSLDYNKDLTLWSVSRNVGMRPASDSDQKLLNNLFKNDDIKEIQDVLYDPDPQFEQLSKTLISEIKSNTEHLMKTTTSSFFSWMILVAFLIELAFFNNFYPGNPGLLAIGTMISISTAAVVYAFCSHLPSFFTGNQGMPFLIVGFLLIITIAIHWGGLDIYHSVPYLSTYFYPDMMAAIAAATAGIPSLPKEPFLLSQIIAYLKHLEAMKPPFRETDLPWIIGLDAVFIFSNLKVNFKNNRKPDWLKNNEEDTQELIQILHETLVTDVNHAINGRQRSSRHFHSSSSGRGDRY